MRLRNPNFVPLNRARVDALRVALLPFLQARSGDAEVDFDAIRTDIGPADLSDGEIAQAAQDAGLGVVS